MKGFFVFLCFVCGCVCLDKVCASPDTFPYLSESHNDGFNSIKEKIKNIAHMLENKKNPPNIKDLIFSIREIKNAIKVFVAPRSEEESQDLQKQKKDMEHDIAIISTIIKKQYKDTIIEYFMKKINKKCKSYDKEVQSIKRVGDVSLDALIHTLKQGSQYIRHYHIALIQKGAPKIIDFKILEKFIHAINTLYKKITREFSQIHDPTKKSLVIMAFEKLTDIADSFKSVKDFISHFEDLQNNLKTLKSSMQNIDTTISRPPELEQKRNEADLPEKAASSAQLNS